jgi:hypothetical protein
MAQTPQRRKYQKEWRARNRDRLIVSQTRYRRAHPERIRAAKLKAAYGLTVEAWDQLYARQRGCCALCGKERKLHVDHCHDTNTIRGLLCSGCNTALGTLGDTLESMGRVMAYLRGLK